MKFAKSIYLVSGLYGLLILIPQYFLESRNGISFPPAINHPEYYYLKVTGSDVENPRQPRQSRLKAIFEAKME